MLHTTCALNPVGYHMAEMEMEMHAALQLSPLHAEKNKHKIISTSSENPRQKCVNLHSGNFILWHTF